MAVCCQNLPLGVLSNHYTPSVLVGALFRKFGLFLNMTPLDRFLRKNTHTHVLGQSLFNTLYLMYMVDHQTI